MKVNLLHFYVSRKSHGCHALPRPALGRIPSPDREIAALQDYRERHAQYKADPDSREVHRQHPFIVTWDDRGSGDPGANRQVA